MDASEVTEIYICKFGQKLEEGILEVSHEVHSRHQAELDAIELCEKDRTIHRIAYYSVKESGEFHLFHTHVNDDAVPPDGYYKPLPPGVRPTIFRSRKSWLVRFWNWFKSLW